MNIDELIIYLLAPASQVALIMGIAEVLKKIGLNPKFVPVVDLLLGIVSGICVFGLLLGYGVGYGVLLGVALGLSACGLFSGVKNVFQNIIGKKE